MPLAPRVATVSIGVLEEQVRQVVDAHLQYELRLQRDGIAVAGGPFAEGDAHADLVGMTVLRVKDLATAQSIAMDDPAVIAGRMSVTVREWRLPAGRLP